MAYVNCLCVHAAMQAPSNFVISKMTDPLEIWSNEVCHVIQFLPVKGVILVEFCCQFVEVYRVCEVS